MQENKEKLIRFLKSGKIVVWNRYIMYLRKKSIRIDLIDANLEGANLYNADLEGANLRNNIFLSKNISKENRRM